MRSHVLQKSPYLPRALVSQRHFDGKLADADNSFADPLSVSCATVSVDKSCESPSKLRLQPVRPDMCLPRVDDGRKLATHRLKR